MAEEWSGRKILVTGATGIIGSWLAEDLVNKGANVTAFVKRDHIGTESIEHLKNKIKIVHGDIARQKDVEKAVKEKEIIFHLAAVTQVLYAADNPAEAVNVNFGGTLNILEAMRKSAMENFLIMTSTDKVYGEPEKLPIREEHPLSSKSPYDAAKLAADRMAYAYHKTYGIKSAILRLSNVYGGRDSNELRIIPGTIAAIMRGQAPVIRRNGKDVRDYMYASDATNAFLAVAENRNASNGEVFNFGTSKPTKTIDVVRKIIRLTGCEKEPVILNKEISAEIDRQYMGYAKARKKLSWIPKVGINKGLRMTIDWYKSNPRWLKVMDRVSNHQSRIQIN